LRDCLNEKRTFFGQEAIKIVTNFFKDEAYANKPKVIAKYALWATRGNGPALFSKLTPLGYITVKGSNGYIVGFWHFHKSICQPLISFCRRRMAFSSQSSSFNSLANISNGVGGHAMTMADLLVL
jgi:hypothetical protein